MFGISMRGNVLRNYLIFVLSHDQPTKYLRYTSNVKCVTNIYRSINNRFIYKELFLMCDVRD